MSTQAKWNLSETYILSQFTYGDIILQGMNSQLQNKIQLMQNNCLRYSFGLRKYDHVSAIRKSNKILCMQDRRRNFGDSLYIYQVKSEDISL